MLTVDALTKFLITLIEAHPYLGTLIANYGQLQIHNGSHQSDCSGHPYKKR